MNKKILIRLTLFFVLVWTLTLAVPALLGRPDSLVNLWLYVVLWLVGLLLTVSSFCCCRKLLGRSEAEVAALAALRRRYENILSAVGEGIVGLDCNLQHIFVNPAAEKMLGYTQAELLGLASHQSWHACRDQVSTSMAECVVCRAMVTGQAVRLHRDQFMRKDGSFFPVSISVSPISEKGVNQGAVVVFQDISEHLATEMRMKKLADLIDQAHSGVIIVGLDGMIEYVNHGYEVMTGYRVAEMQSHDPRELFSTEENLTQRHDLWQAFAEERDWRGTLATRHKNGTVIYEDTAAFPLRDDQGRMVSYAVIKHDVTKAQKFQERLFQAQKMEAVGTLASGVAHDFNNILTVINSFSETLIDECGIDSPIYSDLIEINEAGQRAADLTRQLLAFSRRQMIVPKEICLRQLIVNLMKMLHRLLGEDIELKFVLPESESKIMVRADPGQLEQVIVNLLVNARDALHQLGAAADGKQIFLCLDAVVLDGAFVAEHVGSRVGRYALVEIRDRGCGMKPEDLEHCFEPFYTTKRLGQGTGLGLSTVYGIVKQNDGYITISSKLGKGTTIRIYWPLMRSEVNPVVEIEAVEMDLSRFVGVTVLLVEDDEKICKIAASRLGQAGFQVIRARDGLEALEKAEAAASPPDLLFTDVVMPVMGGVELSRRLRESWPALPVLFSSGYSDVSLVKTLGAREAFIQKPYTITSLLTAIAGLLDD
ncbi:MAG: PAS domain S-box protein [Deltaproteobacteria bacterium]|nr:PAS domain S-box protein [Deltaproteobacteria bacterium]